VYDTTVLLILSDKLYGALEIFHQWQLLVISVGSAVSSTPLFFGDSNAGHFRLVVGAGFGE